MQLYRLSLAGIGPFAIRQEIDFTQLAQDGIFLLTGQTGAGKSTIIDAVVFALYGDVAGGDESDKSRLVSTFRGDTEPVVELIFETAAGLFKVRRTPAYERQRARGTGTTTQNATCKVWRMIDVDQESDEAYFGIQEANQVLARVIGLTKDQFTQTVVLPQGKFAAFLHTTPDNRVSILQTIFGTEFYEHLRNELKSLAATHTQALRDAETTCTNAASNFRALAWTSERAVPAGAGSQQNASTGSTEHTDPLFCEAASDILVDSVDPSPAKSLEIDLLSAFDASDEKLIVAHQRVAQLESGLALRTAAMITADDLHAAIGTELQLAERAEQLWNEKQEYLHQQDLTHEREAEIIGLRERVQRARLAGNLRPFQDAVVRAETKLVTTNAMKTEAQHSPALPAGLADLSISELGQRVTELQALAPELQRLAKVEVQRDLARAEAIELTDQLSATQQTIDARTIQRADWLAKQKRIQTELDVLADAELKLVSATRAFDEAKSQLASHDKFMQLSELLSRQLEQERLAQLELTEAKTTADQIRSRWLANLAGMLSKELRPESPCPVCGSTNHPAPAARPNEDSTKEAVDAADLEVNRRQLAAQTAREQVLRLGNEVAIHPLNDISLAELREKAAATQETLEVAKTRESDRINHLATANRLRQDLDDVTSSIHRAELTATKLTTELKRSGESIAEWSAEIAEQLAGRISIQARQQDHQTSQRAAEHLLSCLLDVTTAEAEVVNRKAELATQLAVSRLSEAELADALLPPGTMTEYENTITQHDNLVDHLRRQLDRPELAALVSQPTDDVPALRLRLVQTGELRDKAIADHARHDRQLKDVVHSHRTLESAQNQLTRQQSESTTYVRLSELTSGGGGNAKGITLQSYVLLQRFKDVIEAANLRLSEMTNGRYALVHTEERERSERKRGLGLSVIDRESDETRKPGTLSGGETFQASLALALGLADAVMMEAGGIELGTMFIDEGFGSLDDAALELVMHQLGKLRDGGRAVGIISHVQELRRQIPNQIVVTKNGDGTSQLSTR